MSNKVKNMLILCVCGGMFYLGTLVCKYGINAEINVSDNTRVKERIVTKIVEKPGKEKVTIITEYRDSKSSVKTNIKRFEKNALVSLSVGSRSVDFKTPVYMLHVQKRLVGTIYGGLYGRSDGEMGITVSYSF